MHVCAKNETHTSTHIVTQTERRGQVVKVEDCESIGRRWVRVQAGAAYNLGSSPSWRCL